MSSKTNSLLIVVCVVSLLLSGVNLFLLINNQTNQQKVNEETQAQLSEINNKLGKINANITTIDQKLKTQLEATNSNISNLKIQTSKDLSQLNNSIKEVVNDIDKHLSETPANLYNKSFKSIVLIRTPLGSGSGFFIDNKNRIVTNWHLIGSQTDIEVEYHNRAISKATVVGIDPYSDLAVILPSIVPEDIQPLLLGNSSNCYIGQPVVTIGNPLGVTGSLSTGIVSQVNTDITIEDIPLVVNEIQLDLTLAPGSSGGALLGLDGMVYGVTNAGLSGFNYAVPSNIVKRVASSIIEKGYYQHPYFGFTLLELNRDNIEYYNIFNVQPDQNGLLVIDIMANYPAEMAGMQKAVQKQDINGKMGYEAKDIILAINGIKIETHAAYSAYVAEFVTPNVPVILTVWRSGTIIQVTIAPTFRPLY